MFFVNIRAYEVRKKYLLSFSGYKCSSSNGFVQEIETCEEDQRFKGGARTQKCEKINGKKERFQKFFFTVRNLKYVGSTKQMR